MSAGTDLRRIFDKRDRKLSAALKIVGADLAPSPTGGVATSEGTLVALQTVRARYRAVAAKVAKVKGGGRAKRALLADLAAIDAALVQFTLAMNTTFSVEQIVAVQTSAEQFSAAERRIRRRVKRLPK
jgi:predicted anti-sigma-YlaC factor YlaD